MRTLVFILALITVSCTKEESVKSNNQVISDSTSTILQNDSTPATHPQAGVVQVDSTKSSNYKGFRTVEQGKIIKTINGDMIPLTLTDEFTGDKQQYILKIKNFTSKNISGTITTENPDMNIRFNQVRLPNGEYDGPFGREMIYKIRENGEIWLLIGRSNMASGESKGRFSVSIK